MIGCTDTEPADVTPTPITAHATDHASPGPIDLANLSQGESYWAVYLVVGPPGDPQLDTVHHELESAGYHPSIGEIGCDQGAAEQLTPPPDPTAHAMRVYFSTESDAQQFVAERSPAPVGTAFVQVFCLD